MNQLHEKLLEIYSEFSRICEKHNIPFYVTGGGALGAMRHRGFIPWDDDIDVGVIRKDWEVLKPILKEEMPNQFEYVDYEEYSKYCNPIIKIVDKTSTSLHRLNLTDGTPHGAFLEIFILDPVPKSKLKYHREMFWIYCELMSPYHKILNMNLEHKEFSLCKYFYYLFLSKICGKKSVLKHIEKNIFSHEINECQYLLLDWGLASNYYPIENFGTPRYMEFENTKVPIGERSAALLFQDYGDDWMRFPNEENRFAHITITNLNVPSEIYMKEILSIIEDTQTNKDRYKKKNIMLRSFKSEVKLARSKVVLEERVAQKKYGLCDFDKLKGMNSREKFDWYDYLYKLYKNAKMYNVKLYIDDIIQEDAIYCAICNGSIKSANNAILNLKMEKEVSKRVCFLEAQKDIFDSVRVEYFDQNYEKAFAYLQKIDKEFQDSYFYTKLYLMLKIKLKKEIGRLDIEKIELLLKEYNQDWDLIKIKADILLATGNKEEALNLYTTVINESDNGMDLLDIKDTLEEMNV